MGWEEKNGRSFYHASNTSRCNTRAAEGARERGGANGAQDMGRERKRNAPPSSPPPPAMADLIFMMREKETSFFLFPFFIPPFSLGPTFFSYSTPTSSALPAVIVPSHFFSSLPPHFFFPLSAWAGLLAPTSGRGHKEGGNAINKFFNFLKLPRHPFGGKKKIVNSSQQKMRVGKRRRPTPLAHRPKIQTFFFFSFSPYCVGVCTIFCFLLFPPIHSHRPTYCCLLVFYF